MKKKILVIHGPNLNLLGQRETNIYGSGTIDSINSQIFNHVKNQNIEIETYQSNHEGELIDKLHLALGNFDGVVINAGAYTHYSYAIRDAITSVRLPCVEVHISNVFARDEFRHKSVISPVCVGVICGFGAMSYILAVDALADLIK